MQGFHGQSLVPGQSSEGPRRTQHNAGMSDAPRWPGQLFELPAPADGSRRAQGGRRYAGGPLPARTAGPLVSYVTVVRNAQDTLERTLQSVQDQSWPQVEHIVVDGLSSDGTLALIEKHAAHIDVYVSEADGGLYEALNKAIDLARGDLICVLNADDWLTRDAAEVAARAHLAAGLQRRRLLLTAAWAMRGSQRKLWSAGRLDWGSYLSCANICHNGVYATPGAYAASGRYTTGLRIVADFRWLMACVDAGVVAQAIETPTVHYSMGGISGQVQHHTAECAQVLQERFAFLSDEEVWGLMHAFHQYRPHLQAFAHKRPAHIGRFLDQLAQKHHTQADFMQALALASTAALNHPDDKTATAKPTRQETSRRRLMRHWLALRARWVR